MLAIGAALFGVFVLLLVALGSAVEATMILAPCRSLSSAGLSRC